jgi:hypothetical protein
MKSQQKYNFDKREDWNRYMGHIWATVFEDLKLNKEGVVVEIGPGGENKIGYGLAEYGFKGKLYVIEPDNIAMNEIIPLYEKVLPNAKIIRVEKMMHNAASSISEKRVDAIIANHPLDDMIIGCYLGSSFKKFYNLFYNSVDCKSRTFWEGIEKDKEQVEKVKESVVEEWTGFIKQTKPIYVAILQYESYYLKKNGVLSPDKRAFEILEMLRKKYAKSDIKDILTSKEGIIEGKRWLVLKNP